MSHLYSMCETASHLESSTTAAYHASNRSTTALGEWQSELLTLSPTNYGTRRPSGLGEGGGKLMRVCFANNIH